MLDAQGVYRMTGRARVFVTEAAAMAAVKTGDIVRGDIIVLVGRGPMGAGMEETFQLTGALRYLPFGKHVALLTDARFSGVSTGACIGHISPEALSGGPIGKLRDGDVIEIVVDCRALEGWLNLVGADDVVFGPVRGAAVLEQRSMRDDIRSDPSVPDDTRIWAALQDVSGGTWGGAVYDADAILRVIAAGKRAIADS
jgi:dihydroxyacid dehydratase/phosphogluconate dehydratase